MNKEKRGRKKQMKNKKGISLIVLIITMIVPYYETLKASKIGKVSPKNKIETMKKLININKVTEIKSVTFNFCKIIV